MTTEEFCKKFNVFYAVSSGEPSTAAREIKAWAAEIGESGTPSAMSDAARKGFEVVVATYQSLDANASAEDIQSVGGDVSAEDSRAVKAFGAWTYENCSAAGAPSGG